MSSPGVLLYKCRLCGRVDSSTHVPHVPSYICDALIGKSTRKDEPPTTIQSLHKCPNGSWGITDLIGGLLDKKQELPKDKIAEAVAEIISIIYLKDNSDYYPALWTVLRMLDPEAASLLEINEEKAFKMYCGSDD